MSVPNSSTVASGIAGTIGAAKVGRMVTASVLTSLRPVGVESLSLTSRPSRSGGPNREPIAFVPVFAKTKYLVAVLTDGPGAVAEHDREAVRARPCDEDRIHLAVAVDVAGGHRTRRGDPFNESFTVMSGSDCG